MKYLLWGFVLAGGFLVLGYIGARIEAYFLRPSEPQRKPRVKPRPKAPAKPRKGRETLQSTRAAA